MRRALLLGVVLVRMLAREAQVLLLDEPPTGVDATTDECGPCCAPRPAPSAA